MEIRFINPADNREKISKIYENSWRYAYKGIIPQDYLDAIPEGRWVKNSDIPGWSTMVCVENGEYIGTSSFCKSRFEQYPDSGEVISIYFLPEFMGKGYGYKLMEAVMGELKKQGFTEVFLSAYTSIPIPKDAIAFVVLIIMLLIKPEGLLGQKNKI